MRISVTTLESYRLWRDPEQQWMSEDELIAGIRGEFKPPPRVLLGSAFGKVLEDPDRFMVPGGFRCNGYEFGADVIAPCLEVIERPAVFEAKALKAYGPCDVVAKADHLLGADLSEFKTTLSGFDFDKYAASYQWRFMLDIFQPVKLTYRVFCLSEATNGVISLRGIESFNLYPYPALHADCCALLRDFVEYVTLRGLDGFLRHRQTEAA